MSRAVMQQALALAEDVRRYGESNLARKAIEVITAIKEAMAQQEHPEQMARLGWQCFACPACGSEGARAFPKPEEDPVAWLQIGVGPLHEGDVIARTTKPKEWNPEWWKFEPLYASPPQRQPLTDEQKLMCWSRATCDADVEHKTEHQCLMDYGSEIEAKHGIGDKTCTE